MGENLNPEYSRLALVRSEILIIGGREEGRSGTDCDFVVPIYPAIMDLSEEVRFSTKLALDAVASLQDDFIADLREERDQTEDPDTIKYYDYYLNALETQRRCLFPTPEIRTEPFFFVNDWGPGRICRLGISNATHVYYTPPRGGFESSDIATWTFSGGVDKAKDYAAGPLRQRAGSDTFSASCHAWRPHNAAAYPQALVLRNWCVCFHNLLLEIALSAS